MPSSSNRFPVTRPTAAGAILIMLICLVGCGPSAPDSRFVALGEKGFLIHGRPYFPLVVNYGVALRMQGDSMWMCPGLDYGEHLHEGATRASDRMALRADMELMRDMGFNAVRLVGGLELLQRDSGAFLRAVGPANTDTLVPVMQGSWREQFLNSLQVLLDEVRNAGLRAIVLVYMRPGQEATEEHFTRIADRFVNDTVILAYDLFNEPLYFEKPENRKDIVDGFTEHWQELTDAHAPNHLTTIGLTGMREVFEWDPNRLLVDFISYHPYEYEPDQVRNEMRWYYENMRVPWIIGETAIPADNDSVPYQAQKEFAERTLKQARACGAWGYSWWQYKDVFWNYFHSDYMGVLNREGTTRTSKSGLEVPGTIKPVADAFRTFDPSADPGPCLCASNYYNYSACRTSRITGRLVDAERNPVASGLVIAWNEWWSKSYHTITKDDGTFELDGCFYFHHWMVSATDWSMTRGDCYPDGFLTGKDSIPTYALGEITIEPLAPHR